MRSLQARVIAGTAAAMTGVLLAAGVLVYVLVRAGLVGHLDSVLIDRARLLASAVEQDAQKVDLEFEELDMRDYQHPDGPGYLQLWLDDGGPLYHSPSLGSRELDRAGPRVAAPACRWLTMPGGRRARAVEMNFQPKPEHDDERPAPPTRPADRTVRLVLAWDAAEVESAMASVRGVLLAVGAAALVLSLGALWLVVRRGLRPLGRMAEQIRRLGAEDLADRVPDGDAPAELRPVVRRLNGLLKRLEAAFRRERSFSADVAHELRTPLAGLRSTLDVTLAKARRPEEYEEAARDCRQIAVQMQAMIENLLALARLETHPADLQPEPTSLDAVVDAAWAPCRARAEARGLRVRRDGSAARPVTTDSTLLGLIVRNVLDNAVAHADEGGTVEIATEADDGAVRLRVVNSGCSISPEQAEMVFERFWRGDAARADTGTHCGLGLSLVRRAAAALGGEAYARCEQGGPFEVTVRIPDWDG